MPCMRPKIILRPTDSSAASVQSSPTRWTRRNAPSISARCTMTNHHGAFGRGLLLGLAVELLASAAVAAERSDEWIKTKAEITLYAMPDVEPSGITVSSKHGYVT